MKSSHKFLVLLASTLTCSLLGPGASAEVNLEPGNPSPTFFLYDLNGVEHFFSDYAGTPRTTIGPRSKRHPLIINFFGVNCKPCEQEIPYLTKLSIQYRDAGLKILLVSKDPKFLLEPYVQKRNLGLTVLVDEYEQVHKKFLVSGIPMFYLVGPDGKIILRRFGYDTKDNATLEMSLRKLFGQTTPKPVSIQSPLNPNEKSSATQNAKPGT